MARVLVFVFVLFSLVCVSWSQDYSLDFQRDLMWSYCEADASALCGINEAPSNRATIKNVILCFKNNYDGLGGLCKRGISDFKVFIRSSRKSKDNEKVQKDTIDLPFKSSGSKDVNPPEDLEHLRRHDHPHHHSHKHRGKIVPGLCLLVLLLSAYACGMRHGRRQAAHNQGAVLRIVRQPPHAANSVPDQASAIPMASLVTESSKPVYTAVPISD